MNTNIYSENPKFLTVYGFDCGYIERRETDFISLELYKEHGIYHVRLNSFYNRNDNFWKSFENLQEAKILFFKSCETFNFKKYK